MPPGDSVIARLDCTSGMLVHAWKVRDVRRDPQSAYDLAGREALLDGVPRTTVLS